MRRGSTQSDVGNGNILQYITPILTHGIRTFTFKLSSRFFNLSKLQTWHLCCRGSTLVKAAAMSWMCLSSICMQYSFQAFLVRMLNSCHRYKGMAASANTTTKSRNSTITPQSTEGGFSQMGGRPSGHENSGAAMSVLLSWHEKAVEVAGLGSITRSMTDWRKV